MYRQTSDRLCQLCTKGEFSDDFGSPFCTSCPAHHTTRGLGSKKESHCYYHRQANTANIVSGRSNTHFTSKAGKKGSLGFMFYNRWMNKNSTSSSSADAGGNDENNISKRIRTARTGGGGRGIG
jgi:hypothetical protein